MQNKKPNKQQSYSTNLFRHSVWSALSLFGLSVLRKNHVNHPTAKI